MTDELEPMDPNIRWIASEARRPVTMDAEARQRLMTALRAEPRPRRQSAIVGWLTEPRTFAVPPLATIAMAAGLVGIGVITGFAINRDGRAPTEQALPVAVGPQLPDSFSPRTIKFVLLAPQAARVSVVGDFNGWDLAATPARRQPDGTWAAFVNLAPGRHVYSFVLDGSHFVNDPAAPIAPDDGFGQKNSVVVVAGASS